MVVVGRLPPDGFWRVASTLPGSQTSGRTIRRARTVYGAIAAAAVRRYCPAVTQTRQHQTTAKAGWKELVVAAAAVVDGIAEYSTGAADAVGAVLQCC